ncbi:hypothetical protein CHLRE_01g037300v5 [Chlamydomonas reinhardtii]|uniref:EF-hand domain-containing protein n=1 Tax=Chlamydomonas reinhardtii TaxID=3055 RepID=A0A2K3E753_CHLRE|nr:uncharacterized protein CHLRE_01g037300v5 [Chlamydomonas reinhardtii]XP_042928654.1 uncharacterized protein CHLRE_01g037300v5 [Chlamydomonas reinhardtii]PNW88617.1 hypothetical protein CHLRE_01g037300v5 [Chlamydomonas reinhardtii]PNW88618.1 hypothetical protein CHLRE_01g037300v5 [Chlamydomonas reinhardtii]
MNTTREHAAAAAATGADDAGHNTRRPSPTAAGARPHVVGDILAASSMEEVLRSAHHLLAAAEQRIGDYCSTYVAIPSPRPDAGHSRGGGGSGSGSCGDDVPSPSHVLADPHPQQPDQREQEQGSRRCWHVYRSFSQARRRLEAAAAAEAAAAVGGGGGGGTPGVACTDLEVLEKLVREVGSRPSELVSVLAANERLLSSLAGGGGRAGAGAGAVGTTTPHTTTSATSATSATTTPATSATGAGEAPGAGGGLPEVVPGLRQSQAEAVFRRLDRRRRGWLDQDDLVAGLELLGEHVDASDVEQICLELGATGRVDMQAEDVASWLPRWLSTYLC